MGDRVAVLKDGLLQQVDTPRDLYDHPNNVFVAGFIGSPAMNLLDAPVDRRRRRVARHGRACPARARARGRRRRKHGHRRRSVPRTSRSPATARACPSTSTLVEELGADAYIYGRSTADGGDTKQIVARIDGRTPTGEGRSTGRHDAPSSDRATRTSSPRPPASGPSGRRHCVEAARRTRRRSTAADRGACRWPCTQVTAAPADPDLLVPAVGRPAGGVAGRPAGRPPAGHLAARRPVRHGCTVACTRSRRCRETSPGASTGCCAMLRAAGRALRRAGRCRQRARRRRTASDARAGLITRHLQFSLPYRALFSSTLRPDTANRLLDALSLLLVRLHLERLRVERLLAVQHAVPARRRRLRRLPRRRRDRRAARRAVATASASTTSRSRG